MPLATVLKVSLQHDDAGGRWLLEGNVSTFGLMLRNEAERAARDDVCLGMDANTSRHDPEGASSSFDSGRGSDEVMRSISESPAIIISLSYSL